MAPNNAFTLGLVLPGGGARGAYQAGALRAIADLYPADANPFPVIVGTSVGAINAIALAAGAQHFEQSVGNLSQFWRTLRTSDVYRTDLPTIVGRGLHWVASLTPLTALGLPRPRSLLDNEPLRRLLLERVDFGAIGEAIEHGTLKAISVTASSYDRGTAVTFFEGASDITGWTRVRREGVATKLSVEHLMAATALPFVFPAQKIGHEYYGDGSLRLMAPLSPAIHTGANKILVIAVRDRRLSPAPTEGESRYPSLGSISGSLLDILFMDSLDADIERARRIDSTLALIGPDHRGDAALRNIEIMVLEPSEDVRAIARRHGDAMPWTIKMLFHRFGIWEHDWRMVSYLMFETPYLEALMDLGYRDTIARSAELARFLGTAQSSA